MLYASASASAPARHGPSTQSTTSMSIVPSRQLEARRQTPNAKNTKHETRRRLFLLPIWIMSRRKRRINLEEERSSTKVKRKRDAATTDDQGHLHGNFPNYYAFNPPSTRLTVMKSILDYISKKRKPKAAFLYCDVGCNEGDLTMEVAKAIIWGSSSSSPKQISVTGVDLDSRLVESANHKFRKESNINMNIDFVTANVCNLNELKEHIPNDLNLLSLFSTTMWLHIHAGDDGFREILKRLCEKTKDFIIIEPQASKSYRSAAARLRKQKRQVDTEQVLDVSTDRLQLRTQIEEKIDEFLKDNHFSKVDDVATERTEWNRSIRLYERVPTNTDQS